MITTIRFLDIQTQDILFYDDSFKAECYDFCLKRDIDCLPALENDSRIYVRDDEIKCFKVEEVSPTRIVDASTNIFNPNVLELFRKNSLLLIHTHGEIRFYNI